jgi:hypothetical protein
MAAVSNKRKVLIVACKVWHEKQKLEKKRKKADMSREFGLVNSTIQTIWKNRTKNYWFFWTGSVESKAISKAWTKLMALNRYLNGFSNTEVTICQRTVLFSWQSLFFINFKRELMYFLMLACVGICSSESRFHPFYRPRRPLGRVAV